MLRPLLDQVIHQCPPHIVYMYTVSSLLQLDAYNCELAYSCKWRLCKLINEFMDLF